ncbi:MAG: polysaccharide biosynthesis C-terminal domain-containing protein [Taibaiella sp.]|nr:polysaccharide biosynthesis C-terminal domain-containing protein [Taibaiella sp.]
MGIVFRQSAKNAIVSAAGAVLGAIVILLSTNYIQKREYGFIGTFTTYAVAGGQLLIIGLNSTIGFYVHKYADEPLKKKKLITWSLGLPTIILTITTILYYLLQPWIISLLQPEDRSLQLRYYNWLPFYTLMFIYLALLEQYLSSQLKVAAAAFMREVAFRLGYVALILLYAFGVVGMDTLVTGNVLLYLLPVGAMFLLARSTKDFGFTLKSGTFSQEEVKEMAHFTWYHFLMASSILLINYMDQLLLPLYDKSGLVSAGIYRNAVFLISLLQVPYRALVPASYAVLAKAFAENDTVKAKDLFSRSSVNIFIATTFVAAVLCCNLQNVLNVIPAGYDAITGAFLILLAGNLVNIATGMNDQVLSITNYYKFNFYLSLVLMVSLYFLLRFLVPVYGVYGAAIATSVTMIVFNLIKTFFIWRKLDMLPFSKGTLVILVAAVPALAAGYFFPHFFSEVRHKYVHALIDACLRSGVILVVYLLMLLWLKPSADLEEYIAQIRKNKRLF